MAGVLRKMEYVQPSVFLRIVNDSSVPRAVQDGRRAYARLDGGVIAALRTELHVNVGARPCHMDPVRTDRAA